MLFYELSCYLIEHLCLYNVEVRKWEHVSIPLSWNTKKTFYVIYVIYVRMHLFNSII